MRDLEELTREQVSRLVGIARVTVRGRGGRPANIGTVRAYIKAGCKPRGYGGPPVLLQAVVMGQDYCTLPEWVEEFELARARAGRTARVPTGPTGTRKAALEHRRAERELDRMGCK